MNGPKRAISSWSREKKLIYELVDEFQLSEDNINRAKEWSSSLKNTTINEMRSIQFKNRRTMTKIEHWKQLHTKTFDSMSSRTHHSSTRKWTKTI